MDKQPTSDPAPSDAPELSAVPELSAAIDKLWARFLPEMRNRVALLETAAAAFVGNTLTSEQQREAHSAAHKLAGTLGTFGLTQGTDLARELEMLYSTNERPDSANGERLTSIAAELRALIEERKSGQA